MTRNKTKHCLKKKKKTNILAIDFSKETMKDTSNGIQ